MSICANTVQANQQSYFFALAGGGGGGASTLQSPASIVPDVTGTATLAVNANQAGGSAAVAVTGGATSSGAITVGGFGTTYRAAVLGPAPILPALPALTIGLNSSATPAISYDGGTGSLILGDGSLGTIQTRNALTVSDIATSGANALALSPINATTSVIGQQIASGGTVSIGSSAAATSTLVVLDSGANTGVVRINGTSGGSAVQIFGGGVPTVSTDVANNGTLQLRSSSAGFAGGGGDNGIVLTDNPVSNTRPLATFRSQIVLPNSDAGSWSGIAGQLTLGVTDLTYPGQASGTIPGGQSVALPLPPSGAAYTGLWMYRILTNAITDTQAIQCGMTLTTYWDGALNAFAYGGAGNPYFGGSLGSVTSNGNVRIVPIVAGLYVTSYIFANFTGSQIAGMAVQLVQVTGAF